MTKYKNLFFIIFIILLNITVAKARWATYDDVSLEVEFYKKHIVVNEDGTNEYIIEMQRKVLKESGRDRAGNFTLNYNGSSTIVTILEAKTINDDKESEVTTDMIEDQPLASSGYGFDEINQILISYPNTTIGSKIYIKYKVQNITVPLDNFFANEYFFGYGGYWQKAEISIDSKLPLQLKTNDKRKILNITKDGKDKFHQAKITLKKPVCEDTMNEPYSGIIHPRELTWVYVSSANSWQEVGSNFSNGYNKVLEEPLPGIFAEILSNAAKGKTNEDIINIVTSQLNEKVQYMGDWRSTQGRYYPRTLAKVASTGVADCKDFSSVSAAILNKLGFKARVALVRRGNSDLSLNAVPGLVLPNMNFNHAMLKVVSPDGKIYWIDPTNFESAAGMLFSDIANKVVLVLDGDDSSYEQIPDIDPQRSQRIVNNNIEVKNNNMTYNHGKVILKGEQAISVTGWELYTSRKQIRDRLFHRLSGKDLKPEHKKSMKFPDLKSRIVEDLEFSYAYNKENALFKTNLGYALSLSNYNALTISTIVDNNAEQITDIFVGSPGTVVTRNYIKDAKVIDALQLNCEISSPWVYVKRQLVKDKNGVLKIEDTVSVLKRYITRSELDAPEYKNLQEKLKSNFQNVAIIMGT